MLTRFITSICLLFLSVVAVHGQTPDGGSGKSFRVVSTPTAPVIDGDISDDVWNLAGMVEDFHEIDPEEYTEPSQRTRVYVLYDAENLYVAAMLWDTEPESITAQILRQGSNLNNDDSFAVILDPYHDRRSGYFFQVNPNGVRSEAIYQNTSNTEDNWQGIWHAEARLLEDGWSLEMIIPYKTLSFDPDNDTWGINFTREIARNNETIGWVSRTRRQNPSVAGDAIGLKGMQQGAGLDVVPSLSMVETKSFAPGSTASDTDPSLDVFYKFTPSLTGVLTLNTDFSATEIDDRMVNLTRFNMFFPEKRDFFLRDADIFEFGRIGGGQFVGRTNHNGRPFFSRTIGLSASAEPVPIEAGAKLTGRVGPWNLGALAIRQEDFEDIAATDLFVGRATLNVLEESNVGVIMTDGDPHSNLDNSLVGVDFNYQNTRLPGGRTFTSEAWFQQSETPGLEGADSAYGFGFQLRTLDKWSGDASYIELQENFNPALGFTNRIGIRKIDSAVNYAVRPRDRFLRVAFAGLTYDRSERLSDGSLQSEKLDFRFFLQNHTNDNFNPGCSRETEGLVRPFTILRARDPSNNVVIAPGEYEFDHCYVNLRAGNQRKFGGSFNYDWGEFFNGDRVSIRAAFNWRPSEHFSLAVSSQVNDIELPEGQFTSRLTSLITEIVFSSTLSWVNLIQWDNRTDMLGINTRLHWVPQAGRDFYLVLNHNLEDFDENGTFHSTRGDLTARASYTFRF